ncbi:MAG: aa3-type cytochrome c oxidase subunit IV [Parvibaculaceae bacterium]|nr:aa3-type cytochrome c oxidase subunit IV [Parvibaculaceae bacterium]
MSGFDDQSTWGKEMDADAHLSTFDGFYKLTKYGTIAMVVLLAGMALFLV